MEMGSINRMSGSNDDYDTLDIDDVNEEGGHDGGGSSELRHPAAAATDWRHRREGRCVLQAYRDTKSKLNELQRLRRKRDSLQDDSDDASSWTAMAEAPMDLSKRSSSSSGSSPAIERIVEEDEAGMYISQGEDEPLNLSVNAHLSKDIAEQRQQHTCNSRLCQAPPARIGHGPAPEHLQKRVRLEETVSYIRRCSNHTMDNEGSSQLPASRTHRRKSTAASYRGQHPAATAAATLDIPNRTFCKDPMLLQQYLHSRDANGSGNTTYPVLRQQLLAVDAAAAVAAAGPGPQSTADTKEEDIDRKGSDNDDDYMENQNRRSPNDLNSAADVLQLLHAAPNGLPWSAYAYYANLLHNLQGTLTHASAGTVDQTTGTHPTAALSSAHSGSPSPDGGLDGETQPATAAEVDTPCLRKRAPRALTGKHVKHGTGASPATLLTLRQKIEQRRVQQQAPGPQRNHQRNGGHKADRKDSSHKQSKASPRKKMV